MIVFYDYLVLLAVGVDYLEENEAAPSTTLYTPRERQAKWERD
jgi:hypothetical protein